MKDAVALARRFVGSAGLLLAILGCAAGTAQVGSALLSRILLLSGALLCAAGVVANRREIVKTLLGGSVRAGTGTAFYAAVVLGVVVLSNFLADQHHWRRDLTMGRKFSLSEFTRGVVDNLDSPVRIIGFFKEGDEETRTPQTQGAKELIREFGFLSSSKIKVDVVDPLREPGVALRYSVRQDPTIIVERGERFTQAAAPDEESLTSAIITISSQRRKKVLFLSGHGERLPSQASGGYAAAAKALEGLNYEVGELLLSRQNEVPADCDVLVIAGPAGALLPEEEAAILRFLDRGGRMLAMTEPLSGSQLDAVLKPWGLRALPQVIADQRAGLRGSAYTPVINSYEDHAIVRSFGSNQTLFPTVGPVEWFETKDPLVFHSYLARTGPDAWGESDLEGVRRGAPPAYQSSSDTMDPKGLPVAAVAFRRTWQDAALAKKSGQSKQETRIVLFGDGEFASDQYYGNQWNGNLFLNAVSWLAQEEMLIGSRQSAGQERRLILSGRRYRKLQTVLAAPMILVGLFGLMVWLRRRKL